MHLFAFTPQQMVAATVGDPPHTTIYHDCGDCGAKAPVLHGCLSAQTPADGPLDYLKLALLGDPQDPLPIHGPGLRLALFCGDCFAARQAGRVRPWKA